MRFLLFFILFSCCCTALIAQKHGIALHGGAGFADSSKMSPALRAAYMHTLDSALQIGFSILDSGGSSLDAVQTVVVLLENSPLFNAGRGAVTTADDQVELDAAIMDGASGKAGAVAALRHIQNPVLLARAVMDSSRHVLLIGEGAEKFAEKQGMQRVSSAYFRERSPLKGEAALLHPEKFGTVGAVALDKQGNLAAATSTGGMQNKQFGRVGDVPIIGAGTYAHNGSVAVSCTGHGEFFILEVVAHEVSALIRLREMSVQQAADSLIYGRLAPIKGHGGLIAIDKNGHIHLPFNTSAMFRAWKTANGQQGVEIWKD